MQFKVLALADVTNLSDAQCAQLKSFVENGGGLVATHETSLYDERGARRPDPEGSALEVTNGRKCRGPGLNRRLQDLQSCTLPN